MAMRSNADSCVDFDVDFMPVPMERIISNARSCSESGCPSDYEGKPVTGIKACKARLEVRWTPKSSAALQTLLLRSDRAIAGRERRITGAHDRIRETSRSSSCPSGSRHRRCHELIGAGRSTADSGQSKDIAALGAGCQSRIDQASAARSGRKCRRRSCPPDTYRALAKPTVG